MKSERKKRLKNHELLVAIINKELEHLDLTYDDVIKIPEWFDKYTMTQTQSDEWRKWSIDFIVKNAKNYILRNVKEAKKEMEWLNLDYGLRIQD